MLGYLKDPEATAAAAPDGWLRTGGIGVIHPDGYVELRNRSENVIISGGENIASVEIEQAIADHPAVLDVAVIAVPDERWGEVPVAYVTLRDDATASEAEIIDRKVQKFLLRDEAWSAPTGTSGEPVAARTRRRASQCPGHGGGDTCRSYMF